MQTVRLTMAQALVRWLVNQRIEIDGTDVPLFPGLFAIFGHGNVTCLSEALQGVKDRLPVWRGQNEQAMALAAIGYNKAKKRKQIMIAASSIGPGATNMVTAAAVAHTNRLPLLLLAGDYYVSRAPDPVLQQLESFGDPTVSVNDCFKPVVRWWDRITRPEQILQSLPQAVGMMLDPADCGPAFLGLCQDTQAEAFDYPVRFFEPVVHRIPRPRPDLRQIADAAALLKSATKPLIIAGGGVRWADAEAALAAFAEKHGIPVGETLNGRTVLLDDHPMNAGPIGIMGSSSANHLAAEADVILAIGTRLQDFTTGSWTLFADDARFIGLNAARFDARKHLSLPVVGDALVGLEELDAALADHKAPAAWSGRVARHRKDWDAYIEGRTRPTNAEVPSYAQVVGAVNRLAGPRDLALTAAGGMPGELEMCWKAKGIGTFDCEFGFSCMGYEIAGGWGAAMADPTRDVFVMVGDGSYLLMNSDVYSSVLTGHKMIIVVCDNGGFAVIDRLQTNKGQDSFNNLIEKGTNVKTPFRVDFAKHAEAMGAKGIRVTSIGDLEAAIAEAKKADRTTVIHVAVHPTDWTGENGSWWECGTPEISADKRVEEAFRAHLEGKKKQRIGV